MKKRRMPDEPGQKKVNLERIKQILYDLRSIFYYHGTERMGKHESTIIYGMDRIKQVLKDADVPWYEIKIED